MLVVLYSVITKASKFWFQEENVYLTGLAKYSWSYWW